MTASEPNPGMTITPGNTALVITDPQNDFLNPKGVTWVVVGESVTKNNTLANIEALLKAAKQKTFPSSYHRTITTRPTRAGSPAVHLRS